MIPFKDEMQQQPDALRRLVATTLRDVSLRSRLTRLKNDKRIDRVIFTGMGSSLYAGYIPTNYLRAAGMNAIAVESAELLALGDNMFTPQTLVVAVSQSGESPEVLKLVGRLPGRENLVAVTNYPASRLHAMSDLTLDLCAGVEYRTSTKTYTNTLAAMQYLAAVLAGDDDTAIAGLLNRQAVCADLMEQLLPNPQLAREIAAFIDGIEFLPCVGAGYSYTTVSHCEIVLEETTGFYASRFTPSQFIHGPIELIHDRFGVVLFDFDPAAHSVCDHVAASVLQYGGKVLTITHRTDIAPRSRLHVVTIAHNDPFTAPLVEVIPIELAVDTLCTARGKPTGQLSRVIKRVATGT